MCLQLAKLLFSFKKKQNNDDKNNNTQTHIFGSCLVKRRVNAATVKMSSEEGIILHHC